jgi:hypothetical protein
MFKWIYTICKISRKKLYLREKQDLKSGLKSEKQSFSKNLADHQFLSAKIQDTD